ncbi:MAG: arylesterase [Gammaproteobacteria bacterium SHHR-1]
MHQARLWLRGRGWRGLGLALLLLWPLTGSTLQAAERWLVLGDSLSAAYGIPQQAGWVALLGQRLAALQPPIELINASLSGETTSGGLQRLPDLLRQHRPTRVLLELGANDGLRGQDLRASQANLERMVQMIQRQGAEVALLGIRLPPNYGPAYNRMLERMYADIAERHGLLFDPFFLQEVALRAELMQDDGLHPNAKAQPLIQERIWGLLRPGAGN